jgi:hypothetical protein
MQMTQKAARAPRYRSLLAVTQLGPRLVTLATIAASTLVAVPATGQSLTEDSKFIGSDTVANDNFGRSVAISGTTAIIGTTADGLVSGSGAAYLFDISDPHAPMEIVKLIASDGAFFDQFGVSVGISGTTAIVGASCAGSGDSGSAYFFDTATGLQLSKVIGSETEAGDDFGISVAISGTTAIVGAPGENDAGNTSGAAYLFDVSDPSLPVEIAKLVASDATHSDFFGDTVGISGGIAIVGADGNRSAYLFDAVTGMELSRVFSSTNDGFGNSVAISGEIAIVGEAYSDGAGNASGSAHLFDISNPNAPVETFVLTASDAEADDNFGLDIAIQGTRVIVGALGNDDGGGSYSGSAYIFNTADGEQLFKLTASDAATFDQFGDAVAISDGTAMVGAYNHDSSGIFGSGAAYLFGDLPGDTCVSFCSSLPNATGFAAVITCEGDAASSLVLTSSPVPDTIGQFFFGPTPLPGGTNLGDGLRCVGGVTTRILPFINAGMMMQLPNTASISLNYTAPYASGLTGTKHFQHWFRSGLSTGAGSNTSDAISVTF